MDTEVYSLVAKYGFKAVHGRLLELMRAEYDFLRTHFDHVQLQEPVQVPAQVEAPQAPLVAKKIVKSSRLEGNSSYTCSASLARVKMFM